MWNGESHNKTFVWSLKDERLKYERCYKAESPKMRSQHVTIRLIPLILLKSRLLVGDFRDKFHNISPWAFPEFIANHISYTKEKNVKSKPDLHQSYNIKYWNSIDNDDRTCIGLHMVIPSVGLIHEETGLAWV